MDYMNALLQLNPIDFERFCGQLLEQLGYSVEYTKHTGDGGIDIIATNSEMFLKGKYVVQCKRYTGNVGEPFVRDLYGVVTAERANKGILISTGGFTQDAIRFASDKQIELIDGKSLERIMQGNNIVINVPKSDVHNADVARIIAENMLLAIDIDKYLELKSACTKNSMDMKSVACLSYSLFSAAIEPSYGHGELRLCDRKALLQEAYRIMSLYNWIAPQRLKDKELAYHSCVCLLLKANICFLLGKNNDAKAVYSMLLEWNDVVNAEQLNNGLIDLLWDIMYSMCAFYSGIGEKNRAAYWLDHPVTKRLFQVKRAILVQNYECRYAAQYYASDEAYSRMHSRELDYLENIISKPYFCPVNSIERIFADTTNYDPILRSFKVPVNVVCFPVFGGDYIVTGKTDDSPTVFFKREEPDGSISWELIIG